ncbi:hypothetical protein KBI23_08455 [bacterium]|nr:hypothetical protein [bacterium]
MSDAPQNEGKEKEGKAAPDSQLHLNSEQLLALPKTAKLETTLFDLAQKSLSERSRISGELTTKDNVYLELNRVMALNNYPAAHLDGKEDISDKDLPKSWNHVHAHQQFVLYDSAQAKPEAKPEASLEERLKQEIKDETSTLPVEPGEGYFQVWKRMHPEQSDDEINKEAHRIKKINGGRDVLIEGERLPTATEEERALELHKRLKEAKEAEERYVPSDPNKDAPAKTPEGKTPEGKTPEGKTPGGQAPEAREPATKIPAGKDPTDKPKAEPGKDAPQEAPSTPEVPKAPQAPPVAPEKGGSPSDPPQPAKKDTEPDLGKIYDGLSQQHHLAQKAFNLNETDQGFIGRTFDAAKNNIGASGEGRPWYDPKSMWSGLFDSDLGSKATEQKLAVEKEKLAQLKQAAEAKDTTKFATVYKELTGQDFDPKAAVTLKGSQAARSFDQSQHNGVDAITDIGVALAVAGSLRSGKLGMTETMLRATSKGALIGGISKAGMMQADGKYANLGHDLAIGSLMGVTVPLGELGGAQLSRALGKKFGLSVTGDLLGAKIETQGASIGTKLLSAAAKSGTSGAIFGATESPGREAIIAYEHGKQITAGDLAMASLKGSVVGFLGGTILGGAVDGVSNGFRSYRPGAVTNIKSTINGVDVPSSGTVGLADAAKILNTDANKLAQLAADKPYEAVSRAIDLYEKTGLNVKKVDPLTGESTLPKAFDDALTTVQNVDLLTAEASLKLSGKVKVVQATDEFLTANPTAVKEPLARVVADPNYQEVIRLKTAQGGQPAADAFEQNFRQGFEKDLKTSMAVRQVNTKGLEPAEALKSSAPEVEAAYKQKAADYFKDMTDPAKRQQLNELVDDIYSKFNPESLSKGDLETILQGVPAADRQLAVALLHESAGTSSDSILKARFQALKSDIADQVGSSAPDNVYTLSADSSANLLGYLYRKSNSMGMSMHNIDNLVEQVQKGNIPSKIVLFDDLSSTTLAPATLEALKKVPKVFVVDVGSFERAINVIDIAKGPQAVAEKLSALLTEAKAIKAKHSGGLYIGSIESNVAKMTMRESFDAAAEAIGPNVHVIRPSQNLSIPNATAAGDLASMSDIDALHRQYNVPKASKEQIANFLSGYVGEERELAARMLAEGAVHNSFPVMVRKAVDLHTKLSAALRESGLGMSDLLVVSDKDPGGSTHLVSYLFGKANGMSPENFVSNQRLNKMIASGQAKGKAVAYFDDTIYSGSQMASNLEGNVSSLMPFKKVYVASLGAYEQGVNKIKGTHLGSLGKVEVATSSTHQPFYSQSHPFYSRLGSGQQYTVKNIGGSEGFGNVQGSLIWSYMYPDNNLTFFGSKFSGSVLRLPGP